jgi:diguanylate cyclase (GGDEF)-like protein
MGEKSGMATTVRRRIAGAFAPFPAVPPKIYDALVQLQFQRLHALMPLMMLAIIANTAAMAVAVMGDLPIWQQALPPAVIAGGALWRLAVWKRTTITPSTDIAYAQLAAAVPIAAGLGLVGGFWGVNAFVETEKFYCIVAPIFIALSVLVTANGLNSVPHAANAAMIGALSPLVVKMLLFPNLGIRSMAVMLILIGLLQARLVSVKFVETVKMLTLQQEIAELADHDSLTGLHNRRAFAARLDAALASGGPVTVASIDLDGFKQANDGHGHHAGDEVLVQVAQRLTTVAVSASSVARLGGDEFALIFDGTGVDQVEAEIAAVRAIVNLSYDLPDASIQISASIGMATSAECEREPSAMLRAADRRLYAEKSLSRTRSVA